MNNNPQYDIAIMKKHIIKTRNDLKNLYKIYDILANKIILFLGVSCVSLTTLICFIALNIVPLIVFGSFVTLAGCGIIANYYIKRAKTHKEIINIENNIEYLEKQLKEMREQFVLTQNNNNPAINLVQRKTEKLISSKNNHKAPINLYNTIQNSSIKEFQEEINENYLDQY